MLGRLSLAAFAAAAALFFSYRSQGPAMPVGRPQDWVTTKSRWNEAGRFWIASAPAEIRSGKPYGKLRYLYQQYCALLVKHSCPLNSSLVGRGTVGLYAWACADHALNLEHLFQAAGIRGLQIFLIRGTPSSTLSGIAKGVNMDHGALVAVIEGMPFVFDPWLPAYLTSKSYANSEQMDFGGIPIELWEWKMRRHGYEVYTHTSELIGNTWHPSVAKALEAGNGKFTATGDLPRPQRATPSRAHWKLGLIETAGYHKSAPKQIAAAGTDGFFWIWTAFNDDKEYVARLRLHWAAAPDLATLVPGETVNVSGSMVDTLSPANPAIGYRCDILADYVPGLGTDRKIQNVLSVGLVTDASGNPKQVSHTDGKFTVPAGDSPDAALKVTVAVAGRQLGESLIYRYRWSPTGAAPVPGGKLGFAGRWKTAWGIVELGVRNTTVTGSYPHDGGKIDGLLSDDGKILTGTWSEGPTYQPPNDAGDIVFTLSDDGRTFAGRYWYGQRKPDDPGAEWNGTRIE